MARDPGRVLIFDTTLRDGEQSPGASLNLEEKLAIMETLWRIVYADGVLDKYEDALARQLAGLLRLSPRQAIDLKLRVLGEQGSP